MLQGSEDSALEIWVRGIDVKVLSLAHKDHDWHSLHVREGLRTNRGRLKLRLQVINLIVHR